MKKCLGLFLLVAWTTAAVAQKAAPGSSGPAAARTVSHSAKAINYRHSASAKVDMRGTELMQRASGEAKVQSKTGRTEVEIKVMGLDDATKFGLEYLTYVAWALSPQ